MAKNQKHYTPEFKQQIVVLYHAGGTSYPQREREYGVNRSTLSGWVKQLSPIKVSEDEKSNPKGIQGFAKGNAAPEDRERNPRTKPWPPEVAFALFAKEQ